MRPAPAPPALDDVTVVIPCHDGGQWLEAALASCVAAGVPLRNLVLVDDGSKDGSVYEAQARHPDMLVLRHHHRMGVAAAREAGLAQANTKFVMFLDQDDRLLCGLREMVAAARVTSAPVAVVGDVVIDRDGRLVANRLWFTRPGRWPEPLLDLMLENVQIGRWLLPASVARRCHFRTDVGVGDDLAFVADVTRQCAALVIPDVVLAYRVHPHQTSLTASHALSAGFARRVDEHVRSMAAEAHPAWRVALRASAARRFRAARSAGPARATWLTLSAALADPTCVRGSFARRVVLRSIGAAARRVAPLSAVDSVLSRRAGSTRA